jgi:hypothetical protein
MRTTQSRSEREVKWAMGKTGMTIAHYELVMWHKRWGGRADSKATRLLTIDDESYSLFENDGNYCIGTKYITRAIHIVLCFHFGNLVDRDLAKEIRRALGPPILNYIARVTLIERSGFILRRQKLLMSFLVFLTISSYHYSVLTAIHNSLAFTSQPSRRQQLLPNLTKGIKLPFVNKGLVGRRVDGASYWSISYYYNI